MKLCKSHRIFPVPCGIYSFTVSGGYQAIDCLSISLESHHRLFRRRPRSEVSLSLAHVIALWGAVPYSTAGVLAIHKKVKSRRTPVSARYTSNVLDNLVFSFQGSWRRFSLSRFLPLHYLLEGFGQNLTVKMKKIKKIFFGHKKSACSEVFEQAHLSYIFILFFILYIGTYQ